jgi:hypothetical protein
VRNIPSLVAATGLLASVAACGPPESPPEMRTIRALKTLHGVIAQYHAETGTLPTSLATLCQAHVQGCARERVARDPVDAWTRPIAYTLTPSGDDYELRSSGADGRATTPDDLVLTHSSHRARVLALAGCYILEGRTSGDSRERVTLDTSHAVASGYAMQTSSSSELLADWSPEWFPWGRDSVLIHFPGLAWTFIVARQRGDTLTGEATSGGDTSPWTRSARIRAYRVGCA